MTEYEKIKQILTSTLPKSKTRKKGGGCKAKAVKYVKFQLSLTEGNIALINAIEETLNRGELSEKLNAVIEKAFNPYFKELNNTLGNWSVVFC